MFISRTTISPTLAVFFLDLHTRAKCPVLLQLWIWMMQQAQQGYYSDLGLNGRFGFALTTCTGAWGSENRVCACPIAASTWHASFTVVSSVRSASVCTNSFSRTFEQLACSMSCSCIISSVFPANLHVVASSRSAPTYSFTVSCGLCTLCLNLCRSTTTFIAGLKCAHNALTAES